MENNSTSHTVPTELCYIYLDTQPKRKVTNNKPALYFTSTKVTKQHLQLTNMSNFKAK